MTPDDQALSDDELLAVIARSDADAVLDRDVAERVPAPVETVQDRLEDLYERGELELAEEDTRGRTWRLDESVDPEALPTEGETETDVESQARGDDLTEAPPDHVETPPDPESRPEEPAPIDADVADAIDAFDLPGDATEKERRREAVRTAYLYLRKRGRADQDDFVADVHPEAPGEYADPDEGWWDEVIRPGLDRIPDVEYDAEAWTYAGDPDDRP
ncbi:hypothetical protein ACFQDG_02470 [Natronoarchaeum mannanilyticum]|uniref:hypothetical protein n=1 Tax=Natronoarchaeum mannanilyticum TaxID=926360 RepID=UPI003615474C